MKSSSSSATPMFRADAETPRDTPNNSNDVVKTDQSAAASSSIQSNLQQPLKRTGGRMIIMDELPFRVVEHEGFRDFCNMMQPRFQVPSRQNLSYLCLTVHFVDDEWKLHKRILNFTPIPSHSGDVIGKCIEKHLLEWGIDKVLTITVDNASSNDVAIKYIKKRLNNWKHSILGSDYIHMRCCAHILNLIVREGLKDLDDSIFRIRSAVRYVRSSPARMQRFKLCVEQEKIESKGLVCLDVETRWNSTFLMLDAAVKFKTTFDRLGEQDFKYRDELSSSKMKGLPTDLDWEHARALLPFLRAFYDATLKLSGSSYVTSNYYFHVVFGIGMRINDKLNDPNSSIKLMASNMREKYHKYWGNVKNLNPLLFISMILDPRHKMDYVIFVIDEVYDAEKAEQLSEIVKQTLSELFDHYSLLSGKSQEGSSVASQSNVSRVENDELLDLFAYSKTKYKRKRAESMFSEGKFELEKYLEDKVKLDVKKFDLLDWWKNKSQTYPIISVMARDILAILVTTVASESAFSTGDSGLGDGELTVKLNLKAEKFSASANEKLKAVGCSLMHG
ncbi:hypothetical protein F3Y22_tig00000218pilonHSYRG00217 [Hibiscus syriacus]|uniref:HAT C-terminal dimerisation domain-containing protein n=1 Tax=Hibiscus syriacus TaxID=106335 RepID=A0A6A3DA49_HIBSY|nr:hypothetical protein F3Y22_tig00000218pilonHSYRG00217 [Hibiscus syriacus]